MATASEPGSVRAKRGAGRRLMAAFRQVWVSGDPVGHSRTADPATSGHPVPADGSVLTRCARCHAGNRGWERKHELTAVQSTESAVPLNQPAPRRSSLSRVSVSAQLGVQMTGPAATPCKVARSSVPGSTVTPVPQSGTQRKPGSAASRMPAHRFVPRPRARA